MVVVGAVDEDDTAIDFREPQREDVMKVVVR
jgi:hypothetical protein